MSRRMRVPHFAIDCLVLLAALTHFVPILSHTEGATAAERPAVPTRVCFPASSWDEQYGVPDSKRPCARIVRVEEDGSVRVVVTDADGTFRYAAGIGARDR